MNLIIKPPRFPRKNNEQTPDSKNKEAPENSTFFRRFRYSRLAAVITFAVLTAGTGVLSLLLAAQNSAEGGFARYLASPGTVALNLMPPVLLAAFIFGLTRRAAAAFAASSAIVFVMSAVNYYKIQIRGDPFMATDFKDAGEAANIIGAYSLKPNWILAVTATFIILGTIWCAFAARGKPKRVSTGLMCSAAAVAVAAASYVFLYSDDLVYDAVQARGVHNRYTRTEAFVDRGFIYPFLHSIKYLSPEKPSVYSDAAALNLLAQYEFDDIPGDRRVNLISIMLEAYCDLTAFTDIEFNTDVYARWHELQTESVSGNLITNIFGGGTIDTERLFMTGFLTQTEYTREVSSYIWYLRGQGYRTEGFHDGDDWYYDRNTVHPNLGFEDYYFLQTYGDEERSDTYFFGKVRELYEQRDKSVPYFSHNLSFQNHGAYYEDENYGAELIERGELTEKAYNILCNYLIGIYDTNERLYEFIETFRDEPEPVVIAIYSDHKPWLGNGDFIYEELGVSLSPHSYEQLSNKYAVPYLIWANDAAKSVLDNGFTGEGGDFSPGFLMNKVFELCSWGGDEYMKAANALLRQVQVVNVPTGAFAVDGVIKYSLDDEAAEAYREYRIVEYYKKTVDNQRLESGENDGGRVKQICETDTHSDA